MRHRCRRSVGVLFSVVALIAALALLSSCYSSGSQEVQWIGFPPGTKSVDGDWQYLMAVAWGNHSAGLAPSDKARKDVRITVEDKDGRLLLDDHFAFTAAGIEATATWTEFENVRVELLEVGNEFMPEDPYNSALVRSGPRTLAELTYRYDPARGMFERSK